MNFILSIIAIALIVIAYMLYKWEKTMSQITDAVTANTVAVTALATAQGNLATAVTTTGNTVADLKTQIANDDTPGNNAAAATLVTNNATLTTAAAAVQSAADALNALTPPAAS